MQRHRANANLTKHLLQTRKKLRRFLFDNWSLLCGVALSPQLGRQSAGCSLEFAEGGSGPWQIRTRPLYGVLTAVGMPFTPA